MEASSLPRPHGRVAVPSRRWLARLSDERLVAHVRRGNEAAFEVVYDRHHRGILAFCRHMLGSQEEAEDALQQTFLSAYGELASDDRPIRLRPWLYTIARNRCLSMLRQRRERTLELPDIPTAGLSEAVLEREDLRRLVADVQSLPEDQRAALVLSELGDLSHREVAEVVGCEAPKVKSLVFQARSSLIESRRASEIPCHEIREQLATMRGGALRRGPLRRHVRSCQGCSEFRDEVRAQRRMLALVLPVIPTAALKQGVLAAAGVGSAAGGEVAATGALAGGAASCGAAPAGGAGIAGGLGSVSGGGLLSGLGAGAAAKVAVAAAVAVGGGVAIERASVGAPREPAAAVAHDDSTGASGSAAASAIANVVARDRGVRALGSPAARGKAGHGGHGAVKLNTAAAAHGHGSGNAKGHHGHGGGSSRNHGNGGASERTGHASQGTYHVPGPGAQGGPAGGGSGLPVAKPPHPEHPAHPAGAGASDAGAHGKHLGSTRGSGAAGAG